MKFPEAVELCKRGNLVAARAISDHCRYKLGMTYNETVRMVREFWPELTDAQWNALMYELDEEESSR
jgi:hypothetical protein